MNAAIPPRVLWPSRGLALGSLLVAGSATLAGKPAGFLFHAGQELRWPLLALCAMGAVAALVAGARPTSTGGSSALLFFWVAGSLAGGVRLCLTPFRVDHIVQPVECALLSAAIGHVLLMHNKRERSRELLIYMDSLALIAFGAVHLLKARDLVDLVPSWMGPSTAYIYATGLIQVVCGLAVLRDSLRRSAAWTTALMFGSWIAVIHAPRLLADPANAFEWQFAGMAICLANVQLLVAGERPAAPFTRRHG